jgi:hypothetical protein
MGAVLNRIHYGFSGGVACVRADPIPLPVTQGEALDRAFELGRLYRDALIRKELHPPFEGQERLAGEFLAGLRARRLDNSSSESEGSDV